MTRVAAGLIGLYAVVLVANGLLYVWWSGDTSEVAGMLVRAAGCGVLCYGLWRAERWAYWLATVLMGLWSVFSVATLSMLLDSQVSEAIFADRPYAAIDKALLIIMTVVLVGAFIMLLLPGARKELRPLTSPNAGEQAPPR